MICFPILLLTVFASHVVSLRRLGLHMSTGFNRKPLAPPAPRISIAATEPCTCNSSLNYGSCCESVHRGIIALTPEKVLRARYSAYVLGLPECIIKTSHPKSEEYVEYMLESQASIKSGVKRWSKDILKMTNDYQYLGFEIVEDSETTAASSANSNDQKIRFRVLFREQDGSLSAVEEVSTFLKVGEEWLYYDGETSDPEEEIAAVMKAEWPMRPENIKRYGSPTDAKAAVAESSSPLKAPKLRPGERSRASGGLGLGSRISSIPKGRA